MSAFVQLQILEEAFQENHYPEVTMVDHLAELLDVRHEKISVSVLVDVL